MRNLSLKLISLLLAFVLWIFVAAPRRERTSERVFAAPVTLVSMSRDFVITTPVPESVDVRLRGRISQLRTVSSQNLEVPVDLSTVTTPGEVTITLRPQSMNVPEGTEVLAVDPNQLRFRVERVRRRTVPIRAFLVGAPPDGYRTGDPMIEPDRVLISGPASQVLKLSEVATDRIIMTGRTETFSTSVAVVSDSPLVRVVSPLTTQVTVPVHAEIGPTQPEAETTTAGDQQTTTERNPE